MAADRSENPEFSCRTKYLALESETLRSVYSFYKKPGRSVLSSLRCEISFCFTPKAAACLYLHNKHSNLYVQLLRKKIIVLHVKRRFELFPQPCSSGQDSNKPRPSPPAAHASCSTSLNLSNKPAWLIKYTEVHLSFAIKLPACLDFIASFAKRSAFLMCRSKTASVVLSVTNSCAV